MWNDLSLRRKGLVVLALPVLAGLLATVGFVWSQRQDRQATTAVNRTLDIDRLLARTLSLVVDNETGVRGFLLTGDETFLEPYDRAKAALPGVLDDLDRQLAAAGEPGGTGELGDLVAERLRISDTMRGRPPTGETAGLLKDGKSTTDHIRAVVAGLQDRQSARLTQQQSRSQRAHRLALAVAALSGLLGVGGGVAAVVLFTNGISRRVRLLQDDADRLEHGQPMTPPPGRDELGRLGAAWAQAGNRLHEQERALRAREAALQSIFAASPDAIHIIDADGRVQMASPAAERVSGRPLSAQVGQDATTHIHPDDLPAAAGEIRQLLNGDSPHTALRYRARHAAGHWLVLESHAATMTDRDRVTGIIVVTRDVTERAELERAQQAARVAADAANRSKSEFLSRMSHELRTPLNAVIGFAQLLELEDLTGEQHDDVARILKGGRHLLDLINEVLDISNIETGRLSLSPEAVYLADLIDDTADLVRPLAAGRGIELVLPKPGTCRRYVMADRQRLKQVLLNLLSNAVKYNHPGGQVTIGCRETPTGALLIDVTDTGPGIKAEHLTLLFTPFERLGAEQTDIEGTGIGLALSQRLAHAMGGALTVSNTSPQGSTFTIEMPTTNHPESVDAPPNSPASPTSSEQNPGHGRHTILHIEDNLANAALVERLINRRRNINLLTAMQGGLGLELAREHHPDLVLLDLHLPDITGMEVLQRLRSHPHTAHTPVVILSADATPRQIQHLLAAGATAYLTKPINIQQLLTILDQELHA